MPSPVTQWQILTPAPEAHAAFYRELLGWELDADNPLGYRRVVTPDGGFEGGFWPAPHDAKSFVQLFVEVEDVQATVDRTQELGGSVLVPPQVLPDGDEMAILVDSHGLSFGAVRSAKREG